jgi:hypothetical protein
VFKFGLQSNFMVVDFSHVKQRKCNLQCNYLDFIQPLSFFQIIIDTVELHWTSLIINMKWIWNFKYIYIPCWKIHYKKLENVFIKRQFNYESKYNAQAIYNF